MDALNKKQMMANLVFKYLIKNSVIKQIPKLCRKTKDISTNLHDSPPRTSGQTSIGFQDGFYYNRLIKHYKGCIQVDLGPGNI